MSRLSRFMDKVKSVGRNHPDLKQVSLIYADVAQNDLDTMEDAIYERCVFTLIDHGVARRTRYKEVFKGAATDAIRELAELGYNEDLLALSKFCLRLAANIGSDLETRKLLKFKERLLKADSQELITLCNEYLNKNSVSNDLTDTTAIDLTIIGEE